MTLAQEYAERFNAIEYTQGNVLNVMTIFRDLDEASEYEPYPGKPEWEDYKYLLGDGIAPTSSPSFAIFLNPHLEGTYTFSDGSKMLIFYNSEEKRRVAEVIEEAENNG